MTQIAEGARLTNCPRCAARLVVADGEPSCFLCGWAGFTREASDEDTAERINYRPSRRKTP